MGEERDFDSESNFEERLIEDQERQDRRQFSNTLLLSIQGLGSIQPIETDHGTVESYVKGQTAEACLKHLCLECRKDIPDKPLARMYLAQYKVLQRDLLNLLTGYPQDKVLSYYVVILMESMTNPSQCGVKSSNINSDVMMDSLWEYKISFMKPLVLQTLMNHFADCVQVSVENRNKIHNQMIELIVLLIRNLLAIPDQEDSKVGLSGGGEVRKSLQRAFIQAMLKESVVAGFIYISQDFTIPLMQRLVLVLVEIYYYLFTPFDQAWLLRDAQEDKAQIIKNLQKQYHTKQQSLSSIPVRHSRFGGLFYTKRQLSESGQISSVPFQTQQVNKIANQRMKPFIRAIIAKQKTIYTKNLTLDIFDQELERTMKEELRLFTIDFLQHCFSRLVECAFNEMNKEMIETDDKIHYFQVIAYFLKFTRLYCQKNIENKVKAKDVELSSEFVYVSAALQLTQFQLIYNNLIHESTQLKKKNFNYRNFFGVIAVLLEYLMIIKELSLSSQQIDRKNSHILMQHIFTHDISKAIRIGFSYCQYGLFNDRLLCLLVQLSALFYDLLESYSQGKTLSIRTNKMLKKKIKKNKQKQRKEQQNENEEDNYGNENEEQQEEDSESEQSDDEPLYKERKFNLISEFAIVVEYGVLEKYFYLINGDKLVDNPQELNISIYKYFKRIVDLLKADWIFFQIDYLYTINHIMHNKLITGEFTNLLQLFRRITVSFIHMFRINKMMSVEVLFRFPDAATKDTVLRNYSDQIHLADDPIHTMQPKCTWSQVEDKALIDNYEKFRDCDNPEEQLSMVLNNLGFSMKSLSDIRRRIKKFRLADGSQKAIQKYHELYEKISMKKEEIVTKSVKELIIEVGETILENFFMKLFDQLREYIEYRGNEPIEMPIPPLTTEQFEYFEKSTIQAVMLGIDLKPPSQGEIYWRLPPYIFDREVDQMKSILNKYILKASVIEDNAIIEEYQPLQVDKDILSNTNHKQIVDENDEDCYDDIFD